MGVRAGLVSAAATAGALIGFGIRHDAWAAPFASLGMQVMHGFGVADAPRFLPSATGIAAHVAWMVLWGIAFAALAYGKPLATGALLAGLVGTGSMLIGFALVPAGIGAVTSPRCRESRRASAGAH